MELEINKPGYPFLREPFECDILIPKEERKGYEESQSKVKAAEEKALAAKEAVKVAKAQLLLADAEYATAKYQHQNLKSKIIRERSAKRRKLRMQRQEEADMDAEDFVDTAC